MKVSVIIPVFNAEQLLERAVRSVLLQPEAAEVILVEDGSDDKSLEVCNRLCSLDQRIVVLQHIGNKNKGVAASRNLGIIKARFAFISFLDADDYYLPGRFDKTASFFLEDNSLGGVYEVVGVKNSYTSKLSYFPIIKNLSYNALFDNLQPLGESVWFHINGLTIKKSVFGSCGLFNEKLKTSEDTLMWFQMAAASKLIPGDIDRVVAIHEKQIASLTSNKVKVQEDITSMLFHLYTWACQRKLSFTRRELVLEKLLFFIWNTRGANKASIVLYRFSILIKIASMNTIGTLLKSKIYRRYFGKYIGYNKILYSFKRSLR